MSFGWGTLRDRYMDQLYEVILIGACARDWSNSPSSNDEGTLFELANGYCGIVIERFQGYARRIGVAMDIPKDVWLAGNPRKELIFLI